MKKILFFIAVSAAAVNLNAQVSLTATSGTTTGTYTTLKGAFDAINAGTHQGNVNISITANTTETTTATLNASGGAASYTSVLVKPAIGVTASISGSVDNLALIKILGSNVTIDGSNSVAGTTRNLTITNTSITAPQVLTVIGATATTAVSNFIVKNTNIINGVNTSSAFVMTNGAATPTGGYFNNTTIQNNSIQKAYIGLFIYAAIAAGNGSGTLVKDNSLDVSGANANRLVGVYLQGVDGGSVQNNTIGNFESLNAEIKRGVWFATGTVNSSITGNTITNLNFTGVETTTSAGVTGISISSGNTGAVPTANIMVSNNTISNFTSVGTSPLFAGVYLGGLTSGVTIDKNKINTIKNTNTGGYGSQGMYLATTSTAANTLIANNIISGISSNGYAASGGVNDNGNGIVMVSGAGYKVYYNTVAMNVNQTVAGRPSAFNVTTGVTAAGAIDLRNNIFVNSQTQAGDRYTIYSSAANTVFSNINYNDYFSSGANLGFIGSARASLTDIQTGFGGNVNSINVLPSFVSATDFHLTSTGNLALDNKGTPVAEVTVDADNNPRSATTPDLGGYEFTAAVLAVNDVLASKNKINYYPNPVVDYVYINDANKIKNVEVYNTVGQRLINENINAEKASVDMRKLPAGVYIIKVNSDKESQTIKIIKK